jgi:hypothetical protein
LHMPLKQSEFIPHGWPALSRHEVPPLVQV